LCCISTKPAISGFSMKTMILNELLSILLSYNHCAISDRKQILSHPKWGNYLKWEIVLFVWAMQNSYIDWCASNLLKLRVCLVYGYIRAHSKGRSKIHPGIHPGTLSKIPPKQLVLRSFKGPRQVAALYVGARSIYP
jgi:hypothetical protein